MRQALAAALAFYKQYVSPLLPRACRFSPTCSEYARLAILEHGAWKGSLLALWRLLRCQPLLPGGIDLPEPARRKGSERDGACCGSR